MVSKTAVATGTVQGMGAKKRQTMGKLIRERERAEKRARKAEKKEAKKAMAAMQSEGGGQPEIADTDADAAVDDPTPRAPTESSLG